MSLTLVDLKVKEQRGRILGFKGSRLIAERLREMGFCHGLEVTFLGRAPFGGPRLFHLGFIQIALRDEEARCARIEFLP